MTNAERKRDARLRQRIMETLDRQKVNHHGGWCTLLFLHDVIGGLTGEAPDSRQATLSMLRDLVGLGYVEEEDNREDRDQEYEDHVTFRLTALGHRFRGRDLPATRLIDDGRIVRD
jgi:hypothetical protein